MNNRVKKYSPKTDYSPLNIFIKYILILMSAFFSLNLFGAGLPAYKLVLFENDHFRNWTYEELKNKITSDQSLIDLNNCNGTETQFLPALVKTNNKNNSLKIQSSKDQTFIIYIDGKLYNSKMKLIMLSSVVDVYTKEIVKLLNSIRTIPTGNILIGHLQKSLYTLIVAQTGGPRFEAISTNGKAFSGLEEASAIQHFSILRKSGEEAIQFTKIGSGGKVRFDPSKTFSNIETDLVSRPSLPAIVLGHELFHAYDSIRGLLDRRYANGVNMEFIETSEYRATFFENSLRKAFGKKYRKVYSSVNGNKSLLDENNEPYLLPTPCIK